MALRLTASASFNWASRGLHPGVTYEAAATVDAELMNIVLTHFNLAQRFSRLTEAEKYYAEVRLGLSKHLGGVGLSRCLPASCGAFLGGLASLARSLRHAYPPFRISQLRADAEHDYQRVRSLDPDAAMVVRCATLDDLADGQRSGRRVQHIVTGIEQAKLYNGAIDAVGAESHRTANLVASTGSASAAIDGCPRWIYSRLSDDEMRTGLSLMLGLPQTDEPLPGPCVCGAVGEVGDGDHAHNPATGEHAFLCINRKTRQGAAGDNQAALAVALQVLPGIKLVGDARIVSRLKRVHEPTFKHAADHIGARLVAPSDETRRFDLGFTTSAGATHYIDCMHTATIQARNLAEACAKQGVAAEAGDQGKYFSYQKSISNLDDLKHCIWFATVDNNGAVSKRFSKLLQTVAHIAYPGHGNNGHYDVDGLRSRCVASLRIAVSCGVWRANHRIISGWAAAITDRARSQAA